MPQKATFVFKGRKPGMGPKGGYVRIATLTPPTMQWLHKRRGMVKSGLFSLQVSRSGTVASIGRGLIKRGSGFQKTYSVTFGKMMKGAMNKMAKSRYTSTKAAFGAAMKFAASGRIPVKAHKLVTKRGKVARVKAHSRKRSRRR